MKLFLISASIMTKCTRLGSLGRGQGGAGRGLHSSLTLPLLTLVILNTIAQSIQSG